MRHRFINISHTKYWVGVDDGYNAHLWIFKDSDKLSTLKAVAKSVKKNIEPYSTPLQIGDFLIKKFGTRKIADKGMAFIGEYIVHKTPEGKIDVYVPVKDKVAELEKLVKGMSPTKGYPLALAEWLLVI